MTVAGFYAPSSQHKRSTQPPETLDFTSYHDRPEIDGSPIHEAPDSPRQYQGSVLGNVIRNEPYSPPPKADGPGSVDVDHLSKLEQEERQLQEDIAQIERLERLKVERDRRLRVSWLRILTQQLQLRSWSYNYKTSKNYILTKAARQGPATTTPAHALRVYHGELKRQFAHLRDHQIATRFGESPIGNEELPQMLPPMIPTFNAVRCESAEKESLTPSPDKDQLSEQSKAPPLPDMLGRGRSATEEDRLSKKRKAAISPPLACKRRKISGSTLKDPTCTVCMDQSKWSEYVPLSCHHGYCLECVMRLFQRAMTDETLFPPQCYVAVRPNSATTVLQNGKLALVTFGARTGFWSAQRCLSTGMAPRTLYPATLVMNVSKKSQERSGQIMGAHTPVLGNESGGKGKGVRTAKISFDGSSMNVQIVGFEYNFFILGTGLRISHFLTELPSHIRFQIRKAYIKASNLDHENDLYPADLSLGMISLEANPQAHTAEMSPIVYDLPNPLNIIPIDLTNPDVTREQDSSLAGLNLLHIWRQKTNDVCNLPSLSE
ncbi:MAG: hypothetical protein Q9198_004223 [Flavoplaca austrocitrina]